MIRKSRKDSANITAGTEIERIWNKVNDKVDEEILMFEESIYHDVVATVPGYDGDWCDEETNYEYEEARKKFIEETTNAIMRYAPKGDVE